MIVDGADVGFGAFFMKYNGQCKIFFICGYFKDEKYFGGIIAFLLLVAP